MFQDVLEIAAGVLTLLWPGISVLSLMYVIAFWAIVIGVMEIGAAISLRKSISNEWLIGLAGAVSIAFGVLTTIFPGSGALALVWAIGFYAVFFGILLIGAGFRLHSMGRMTSRLTG